MSLFSLTHTHQKNKELHTIAPFILPFLKFSSIYFIVHLPEDKPNLTAAFVKCVPVLYLVWFVWLQGISTDNIGSYNRKIFYGLILSCVGDIILIWGENDLMFIGGTIAFGLAHTFYISAFGWTGFGWKGFAYCSITLVVALTILLPNVSSIMSFALVIYATLVCTMTWRGLARCELKHGNVPWRKLSAAIGGVLFGYSDTLLGIDKFCVHLYFVRELVMVTYYVSQLLLSLSVINSQLSLKRSARERGGSREYLEYSAPLVNGYCQSK